MSAGEIGAICHEVALCSIACCHIGRVGGFGLRAFKFYPQRFLWRPGASIEPIVMTNYDRGLLNSRRDDLLDRRFDGIDYVYPLCSKYRDALTAQMIQSHLAMLRVDADRR